MVEGRGIATMIAENSEYPAQMPFACTKYLQNAKSKYQKMSVFLFIINYNIFAGF
jgi:hypothetical protein